MVTIRQATWIDSLQLTAMWAKMHLEITTRPAMLKENSDVSVLFSTLAERLKDPNWVILIAEEDGTAIGFVMGKVHWPLYSQCHIMGTCEAIYIVPEHRGSGAYKELMNEGIKLFKEKGVVEIEFYCRPEKKVLDFYDHLGYEPVQVVLRQKETK